MEPIKVSTIKQFKWCAIDSYVEHLAEIGDIRVSLNEPTQPMKKGEEIHSGDFGLRVMLQSETSDEDALNVAQNEGVVATNYKNYQIQGVPDKVECTDEST